MICPYCGEQAKLVTGKEIYPHRQDLYKLHFWSCGPCEAYVGCHKKSEYHKQDGTTPLGTLANRSLRTLRADTHKVFDLLWGPNKGPRLKAYSKLATKMGIPVEHCHIGMFNETLCLQAIAICEVLYE